MNNNQERKTASIIKKTADTNIITNTCLLYNVTELHVNFILKGEIQFSSFPVICIAGLILKNLHG